MRSRYSAFALGLGQYLRDTVAAAHPDRSADTAIFLREIARSREGKRYVGLTILHTSETQVLFYARIFEKGIDRSFVELSVFAKEEGEWRYASGELLDTIKLPPDPTTLDLAAFHALLAETQAS